jgi:hypothetical protein
MREKIAEHIYTHVSSMCEVFGEESAADAIIAMPEISNAQAKISELENALAAASGTIAAMRADVTTGQARIAGLEAALFLSRVAWENALEVGLFPPEYGKTALELIEHHRAALRPKP